MKQTDLNQPVSMCCATCGSDYLHREAWVKWDKPRQEWILERIFDGEDDSAFCFMCDGAVEVVETPTLEVQS